MNANPAKTNLLDQISRRGVLAGLMGSMAVPFVGNPALAEAPTSSPRPARRPTKKLPPAEADLINAAKLGGVTGFAVADLATGRVLASGDDAAALPPASVCKAVTALYALEKLGVLHRFTTKVMRRGVLVGDRLDGDLILVGGGDPTLDTDMMGDLVASLAQSGLRQVTGRFLVYAGDIPQRDRIAADQPDYVGYNPAVSGLMLNYNRVYFEWRRANGGWSLTTDARGQRFVPKVAMVQVGLSSRTLPIFAYTAGSDQTDRWTVAESALGKEGSRWLPVRHPAAYAAEVFQTLCAAQGLKLPAAQMIPALPADAQTMVQHQSAALPDVLRDMLKFSTNLTAEAVGLAASGAISQDASASAMTLWAQNTFGIAGVFGDHSGLGPVSRIPAGDMMSVMIGARATVSGRQLLALMREMGVQGPDGKDLKGSAVRVHAKSGTLNFVSCLAGYIAAPTQNGVHRGGTLAFAIFCADVPRRDALEMQDREDPAGGAAWTRRARKLQGQMIAGWSKTHLLS